MGTLERILILSRIFSRPGPEVHYVFSASWDYPYPARSQMPMIFDLAPDRCQRHKEAIPMPNQDPAKPDYPTGFKSSIRCQDLANPWTPKLDFDGRSVYASNEDIQ
jgi:hypothetical protein